MEEGLAYAAWLLIELVLIHTGRLLVPALTAGLWRGEKLDAAEGRTHGAAGALSFKRHGQRVITSHGLFFIGLMFYIGLGIFMIWLLAS